MIFERSCTVKQATNKIVNPPAAQIFRAGQAREMRPAGDSLRRALQTRAHVAHLQADRTLPVHAVPIPLFQEVEIAGKPGLAYGAGWEPIVQRLLRAEGFTVETIGTSRSPLDAPEPD